LYPASVLGPPCRFFFALLLLLDAVEVRGALLFAVLAHTGELFLLLAFRGLCGLLLPLLLC
jgi:hypothetical protein